MIAVECMACHEAKQPLEPWTYEIAAEPPAGQVDVEISHCGVCGSDIHQLENSWGVACFPLVPGHEIVGKVIRMGVGVEKFQIGQRVGIGVQRSNCGACDCCNGKIEQLCPKITKTYAGPGKDKGGFSRVIRYTADWTFAIPDQLLSEYAAPLLCAGITTFSPLKRHCRAGMNVGIVGVGGLGHIAIQIARGMDCNVTAISRDDSKRTEATNFGATSYVVSSDASQIAAAKGTLDVILNTASGVTGMDDYLSLLKPRGVHVCVGIPEKDAANMTKLFMHSIVPAEKTLVGSYLGPKDDYAEMLAFCVDKKVVPAVEVVKFEEANVAVQKVKAGTAKYRMVLAM